MVKPSKKLSTLRRNKKNEKPTVGCGLKNPTVVRHHVPPRYNQLSQQNVHRLQTTNNIGAASMQSTLRRGIGSGTLLPHQRSQDWHPNGRFEEQENNHAHIQNEQHRAKEMLQTLANEVNGLRKDKEQLRRATENGNKAHKKTVEYLSPAYEGEEGVKITTEGVKNGVPPEEVFLKALSPSKGIEEKENEKFMHTPQRKIEKEDEHFRDTEKVLEMSPPLIRYNPTLMQHTFEMNLDGITLEELEQMKKQNENRLKDIEEKFMQRNLTLEGTVQDMTEYTKDEQYLIKAEKELVQVPISSFAELDGDMLLDTNESEADEHTRTFSKRLIYELKFEKYLKKKIKEEIVKRDKFKRETIISSEDLKRLKIEKMVRTRLEGKILTPEEEEQLKLQNQSRIDCDDGYLIILKQIFNEVVADSENSHPNVSDDENYEVKPQESVDKNIFVERIFSIEKAQPFLHLLARDPNGVSEIEAETFAQVLQRLQKNYSKRYIVWEKVLPYFTRKGAPIPDCDLQKLSPNEENQEVDENERAARNKAINQEVKHKMSNLPMFPKKEGEGKYRITIPSSPGFEKRGKKKGLSIREKKLQEMIKYNDLEDEYEMSRQFRAQPVPKSTIEPRYHKIIEANEKRRQEVKQKSIILTKQTEKPFSFYERDMRKLHQPPVYDPEYDVMSYQPFKANPVPRHAKNQTLEYLMKKDKKERDLRIKKNAELALQQSSLPPRMAMYEKQRETKEIQKRSKSLENPEFTFKPMKSKPVPDFERIQLEFQRNLDSKKKSKSVTKGEPFRFAETKPNKAMRQYMDAANRPEEKLMTFKMRKIRTEIDSLKPPANIAQSTLKFDAQIANRRKELENKLLNEHLNAREELERKFKQTRMRTRVKKSPAIVDNRMALREMRERAHRQAKETAMLYQKIYERKKAEIEVNVANRPLLVEMASKNFYKELMRMQEVEQYANLLREARFDPEDHLTEEQKILLQKAEAFEQLNAEHAYFPTVDQGVLQQPMEEQMEGEGYNEEEYEEEGDDMEDPGYIEQVNEAPELEEQDHIESDQMDANNQNYADEDYEEEFEGPPQPEIME